MKSRKQSTAKAEVIAILAVQESIAEPVAEVPVTQPKDRSSKEEIKIKQPVRLWAIVLFLGWMFDFLFWKKPIGINFAFFSFICLIGGFYLLSTEGYLPARNSLWLLIPFAFFVIVTFVREEPLT